MLFIICFQNWCTIKPDSPRGILEPFRYIYMRHPVDKLQKVEIQKIDSMIVLIWPEALMLRHLHKTKYDSSNFDFLLTLA